MIRGIRVYIEGGGDGSAATKRELRLGFSAFLSELATKCSERQLQWNVTMCGPRDKTHRAFRNGMADHPGAFNVLLVDSESPVVSTAPWAHLKSRDGWDKCAANNEQCHLMVQTMEAWLIADPEALAAFYGKDFRKNKLPARKDVEEIPKDDLLPSLHKATVKTTKGEYHKTRHAPQLLARICPATVRQKAPHCDRLFETLTDIIETASSA